MRALAAVAVLLGLVLAALIWTWREPAPRRGTTPAADAGDAGTAKAAPTAKPAGSARPPVPPGHIELTARIVTADRVPVVGATATLRGESTTTDAQGRFRLVTEHTDGDVDAYLVVCAPDGSRLDYAIELYPHAHRHDLGYMVVRPPAKRRVRVRDPDRRPVAGATVIVRFPWGYSAPLRRLKTGPDGIAVLELGGRDLEVLAWHAGSGRAKATLEAEAAGVDLTLRPARTMRVRVLDGVDKQPVAGAQVRINRRPYWPPLTIAPTDIEGWTIVSGVAREDFTVFAEHGSYPEARRFVRARKSPDEIDVLMKRWVDEHWPLRDGELPVPAEGTAIALESPAAKGVVQDGLLVFRHPNDCPSFGVAPDGSIAHLTHDTIRDEDIPRPAEFRRPRSLTVRLRWPDGRPADGVWLSLHGEGAARNAGPRQTDGAGEARWTGIYAPARTLHARLADARTGLALAEIDFAGTPDDPVVEQTLPAPRRVHLYLSIDGKPGLPRECVVAIDRQYVPAAEESLELGRITFELLGDHRWLNGRMHTDSFGGSEFGGRWPESGEAEFRIELVRQAALVVEVKDPEPGEYYSHYDTQCQVWDAARSRWTDSHKRVPFHSPRRQSEVRIRDVAPGRYRLVHTETGAVSNVADAGPGEEARLVLRIGPVHVVAGRVALPDGVEDEGLRILVEGDGYEIENRDPHWRPGREAGSDGAFRFRVAGDQRRTIRAVHPVLGTGPSVLVSPPSSDVELSLPQAPRIRFEPVPAPSFRIMLIHGSMARPPQDEDEIGLRAKDGDVFEAWPFQWSTYPASMDTRTPKSGTLWVDLPGLAPRLLENLPSEPGLHDLGKVRFSTGASIAVRIEGHPGAPLQVEATHLGRPAYTRGRYGAVRGLGPGRFRVAGHVSIGEDRVPFSTEVTVAENEKKEITIRIP